MTKVRLIAAVGLAVAAGVGAWRGPAPAVGGRDEPARANAPTDKGLVRGRALTPDGKPAAGAKLFLIDNDGSLTELGAAGADGRFAVEAPRPGRHAGKRAWLAVKAPGYGVDFVELNDLAPRAPAELRLRPDRPIRGRVIDLQGKPVAGVTVRLNALSVYGETTVEPFLAALLKRPHFRSPGAPPSRVMWGGTRKLLTATTDARGRFELAGAGAERLVSLRITGPGIAQTAAQVITRNRFDPEPYNAATRALRPKGTGEQLSWSFNPMLLGPDPTVVAAAEKPIRGLVTDDKGKPRAGVRVWMEQDNGTQSHRLEATTGRDGRYEMRGAFKAPEYTLTVESDPATGMVRRSVTVADTGAFVPLTADIRTARGVVVTGRVTDRATGKPVPGRLWVGVLGDNRHAALPEYRSFAGAPAEDSRPDGTFRVVAIPGRVLLMAGPNYSRLPGGLVEGLRYRLPAADPRFPNLFESRGGSVSYRQGQAFRPVQGSWCRVLEVEPAAAEVRQDVALERAPATKLSLRDAAGRPVAGTWVAGLTAQRFTSALWCASAEVEVYAVEKTQPRVVTFFDPKGKLAGTVTLRGDERQPVVVTLGPPGVVRGRLLQADGRPAAGVTVSAHFPRGAGGAREVFREAQQPDGCALTDKNGAFTFDRMLPGLSFELLASPASAQGRFRTPTRPVAGGRTFGPVKAGQTIDLGTVTLREG